MKEVISRNTYKNEKLTNLYSITKSIESYNNKVKRENLNICDNK